MKTALITGASSGIGREFALLFAMHRYNLVIVARSEDALSALADQLRTRYGITVFVIVEDLSCNGAAERVHANVMQKGIEVDVLINNAGFGDYGALTEADPQKTSQMMQLNMVTLTELTKLFLSEMKARSDGKILNVASTAAFQPGPYMAVYFATKAYVLSFSEALHAELDGSGVSVTTLCPGPTRTGFEDRASERGIGFFTSGTMQADDVARIGYRALMAGKAIAVCGVKNKLLVWSTRFVPRAFVRRIMKYLIS